METIPQPTTVPPAFLQMKKSLQTEFRAFCCRLKDSHPVWEMVFNLSFEEIAETWETCPEHCRNVSDIG